MERLFHYYYASEKFAGAVHSLATGRGDVRSRLWDAYMEIHAVREENIPDPLKEDFDWIMKMLTKSEPLYGRTRVETTLKMMRNQTGEKIAERICNLQYKLKSFIEEAHRRRDQLLLKRRV